MRMLQRVFVATATVAIVPLALGAARSATGSAAGFVVADAAESSGQADAAPATAQTAQDDGVDRTKLEAMLEKAIHGSAVIRPQAAARLVTMGAPAAERILALCEGGPAAVAPLGAALVEVLAAFDEPRLRALLWECLADRDFPWRPAAARSLALHPRPDAGPEARDEETAAFRQLLSDPIAPVRMAAAQAFELLHPNPTDEMRSELRALLNDPSDFVRRAAAVTLVRWDEPEALLWLVEDLRRTDTFFERWSGKNAAYESRRVLAKLLGDVHGYDPESPPGAEVNLAALEKIEAAVRARIGTRHTPALPQVARASAPVTNAVLGLELVSCRRGEHYLCWTAGDELLVGLGNPARVKLPEGTTARLLALAREELTQLDRPFYGEPGCDLEMLRVVDPPGGSPRSWIVSKGQARVEGLRPEALGRLMRALVASIPEPIESADPRLAGLRRAAAETMESVGGP